MSTIEDAREQAREALADYGQGQPGDYERAYADPLALALRALYNATWAPVEHGRIMLKRPDGSPKSNDEIRAEAESVNAEQAVKMESTLRALLDATEPPANAGDRAEDDHSDPANVSDHAEDEHSAEDEREALAYLITAHRFKERGLDGAIGEVEVAVSRPLADFLAREGFQRYAQVEGSRPITDEMVEIAVYAAWNKRTAGIGGQVVYGPPADLYRMVRAALEVAEEARR